MKKLQFNNYQEKVEESSGVKLIKFGASWCGPCRHMLPFWKRQNKLNGKFEFFEVDVDEEPELSAKFQVRSVPATFIVKNGQIVKSFVGMQNSSTIMEVLEKA